MRTSLISILIVAVLMFGTGFYVKGKLTPLQCENDTITIVTPPITGKTDTIFLPGEVVPYPVPGDIVVDSSYYHKYLAAETEVERLALLIEAIKLEEKKVTLVDNDTIKIDVTSKTRGKLIYQFAEYEIKEHVIDVPITKPRPTFLRAYGGMFINASTYNVGLGLKVDLAIKEKYLISIGHDFVNSSVYVGYSQSLFKIK